MNKFHPITKIINSYIDAFKNMFVYNKRTGKLDFWGFMVINSFVIFGLNIFSENTLISSLGLLYIPLSWLVIVSLMFRRAHDIDLGINKLRKPIFSMLLGGTVIIAIIDLSYKTSYFVLLISLILLGTIIYLLLAFLQKGKDEENKYGNSLNESSESFRLANVCALMYLIFSIANRVMVYDMLKNMNVEPAQVKTEQGEVIKNSQTDAETTVQDTNVNKESIATKDEKNETAQVPMHSSVE